MGSQAGRAPRMTRETQPRNPQLAPAAPPPLTGCEKPASSRPKPRRVPGVHRYPRLLPLPWRVWARRAPAARCSEPEACSQSPCPKTPALSGRIRLSCPTSTSSLQTPVSRCREAFLPACRALWTALSPFPRKSWTSSPARSVPSTCSFPNLFFLSLILSTWSSSAVGEKKYIYRAFSTPSHIYVFC